MQCSSFEEAVGLICAEDKRYDRDAYLFLRDALEFTIAMLKKPVEGPGRHVSGRELLEGIRCFTIREFGPVARMVLNTWGVRESADLGEIVFNLVDKGILGATESDKKEDFANAYDFDDAFVKPFVPECATTKPARGRKRGVAGSDEVGRSTGKAKRVIGNGPAPSTGEEDVAT
ncbi:MAG: hypothetical protein E4H02_09625 [Lentisphaerales bacterium]|jgi:uncharacterized repeat protein (TIGR04138 family)|nr:MAG: hypothetical protein E4H02_09625 [Lentisphaerales bacterium]